MIKRRDNTTVYLPVDDSNLNAVKKALSYKDKTVEYEIKRIRNSKYAWKSDPQKIAKKIETLKEEMIKSLLWMDEKGYYTLSGLANELSDQFNWPIEREEKPDFKRIPIRQKTHELRDYQSAALSSLLKHDHASIEIPTGSGKGVAILHLLINQPVKTLIVAPLSEIADQLYKDILHVFGPQYVCKYSSTKKTSKLFTVATAQGLTRVNEDHHAWADLSTAEQIIFDESHACPAETFKSVCLNGVGKNARYRYFFSATQIRADGKDLLLRGIIGPTVYRLFVQDLVDLGYLKEINVSFLRVPAVTGISSDPKEETRRNLYENPGVYKIVSEMCAKIYDSTDLQTLILIEEYSQFAILKNYLARPFEFAHGTVSQEAKKSLPKEYWDCDIPAIVDRFNRNQNRIMIGTTAVSTGVDIRPTGVIFYLQGGKSEVKVKQGIGRGTRPVGPKQLKVFDFIITGSQILERHAAARQEIYESITNLPIKVY